MRSYFSPVLFHGPGAREVAMAEVPTLGRLIHEPFGEDGLKVAESREIIELMNNTPIGDEPGVVVIGPMDQGQQMATDVLLKSIEEYDPNVVRPVLWALNEPDVSPTIRSRCLRRWCPGEETYDELLLADAERLVTASLEEKRSVVLEVTKEHGEEILSAVARVLSWRQMDSASRALWGRVRDVLCVRKPTATEILVPFL